MASIVQLLFMGLVVPLASCGNNLFSSEANASRSDDVQAEPRADIPRALTFQHPIAGLDTSDYGFGFGSENRWFCMQWSQNGQCMSYGAHLGRDTVVGHTPEGTEVVAPADGIVRVTSDITFGGYGSDSSANPAYSGCVIVLEHQLGNGQMVTTLLGHLRCDRSSYDALARRGNPPVGTVVRRGQYIARVGHYWHGSGQATDWHHLHWAMRKGAFTAVRYAKVDVLPWVQGYAPRSEFTTDAVTGALVHPQWLDPFLVVAANGDPVAQASANVRHHPPGSLLRDPDGMYWFVATDTDLAPVTSSIFVSDRYDANGAVAASHEEVGCYRHMAPVGSSGPATLYVRPGSNAVVIAYDTRRERYDFIRWEALLSWGFTDADISSLSDVSRYEAYPPRGFRMLRPGTLVKADEASEVAVITAEQKRLPIISGDVFEHAGFKWERIVSLPQSVLDQVAGPRENSRLLTLEDLHRCAVPPGCPGGATSCGGGAPPGCTPGERIPCACTNGSSGEQVCASDGQSFLLCTCPIPPESDPPNDEPEGGGGAAGDPPMTEPDPPVSDAFRLTFKSPVPGPLSIQGWWGQLDGINRTWDLIPCPDENPEDDLLACDLPVPSGAPVFEFQVYLPGPAYWGDQSCSGGGCGEPLGSLTLTKNGMNVPVTFVPNPDGPPYYNGQVAPVP